MMQPETSDRDGPADRFEGLPGLDGLLQRPGWARIALNAANMGAWDYDLVTGALIRSPRLDELFGFGPDARPSFEDLRSRYHPDDRRRIIAATVRAFKSDTTELEQEFRIVLPCGAVRWLSARGEIIRAPYGQAIRTIGVMQDITEQKRAAERQDLLLKETNHRIKNNLQMVSSLLNIQARRIRDPEARHHFEQAIQRVETVASLHAALYQSTGDADDDPGHLEFAAYLRGVADKLRPMLDRDGRSISITVEAETAYLPMDAALPLGIGVAELVTNAAKHGFAPGAAGHVAVRFRRQPEGGYRLVVADNGCGLPGALDDASGGLGFRLIRAFTGQIGGRLAVENRPGLAVTIDVPPHAAQHQA